MKSKFDKIEEKCEKILLGLEAGKLTREEAMRELRLIGYGRHKSVELANKVGEGPLLDWRHYPL